MKVGSGGRTSCKVVLPLPPEGQPGANSVDGKGAGCPQEQGPLCYGSPHPA